MSNKENLKKIRQVKATALRDSKDKSVLVRVELLKLHPVYKKRLISGRKMLVHTDLEVKKGQTIWAQASRPTSRRKSWKVIEVK